MNGPDPIEVTLSRRGIGALAVAAGIVALAAPGWAGPVARVVLVVAGTLLGAAGAATLVRAIPFATSSRFEPASHRRERREVPPELESLTRAVRNARSPTGRQVLDPTVLLHVRRLAVARLGARHLDVDDPADQSSIEQHVSIELRTLLGIGPAGGRAQHLPSIHIPAASLPALLDELERL